MKFCIFTGSNHMYSYQTHYTNRRNEFLRYDILSLCQKSCILPTLTENYLKKSIFSFSNNVFFKVDKNHKSYGKELHYGIHTSCVAKRDLSAGSTSFGGLIPFKVTYSVDGYVFLEPSLHH